MVNKTAHNKTKRRDIMSLIMLLGIVGLLNFIGFFVFKRFDLTSEKRYTLAESTRKLLNEVEDVVFLKIYLHGNLNPSFTRLKNETKELLDVFRSHANGNIEYEFINVNENANKEEITNLERQLYEKGIVPEQVIEANNEKTSQSLIWPGALVTYKNREVAWQIYKRQVGIDEEVSINNSVQELEYGLTNIIRKIQRQKLQEVSFIEGHGESDTLKQFDFMHSLAEYYTVNRIEINGKLSALKDASAIVITKPDSAFTDKDKFIIDQYVMNGGKVLWLVDPVMMDMDTFRLKGFTLGFSRGLNIEDMLFKYGVRVNPVLIQDLQCGRVPVNIGFKKGQPNFQLFPWLYTALVLPDQSHPIVKNLDLIKMDYVSTIDTVKAEGIKKTVLLRSSKYTKVQPTPCRISLGMVQNKPREEQFRNSYQTLAVLLEGEFNSVVEYRLPAVLLNDPKFKYLDHGKPTKMIVVADGDIASNEIQFKTGSVLPLGYDKYTQQTFANKNFLLNCVNYLLDDEGLLQLRT
ncbi:MAG: gliding motility-associated ABC transporter substrate-binding protein GldG, partial [Flavobacteriales bacterium]|nr:gliding motility-associated ABC transporter substrate-binding protein GldG [Flavobacteriales bacterium]